MTTLADALALAQSEMENPKKTGKAYIPTKSGKDFSYKYAELDEITNIIRRACNKHGIFFCQPIVHIRTELGRVETLQTLVRKGDESLLLSEMELRPYNDEKTRGAQLTYLRRQEATAAFGLAGEDDTSEAQGSREPLPPKPYDREKFDRDADDKRRARETEIADKRDELKDKMHVARSLGVADAEINAWVAEKVGKPSASMSVADIDKILAYLSGLISSFVPKDEDVAF